VPPKFTCCPHIQKLADRSDAISEVPKCTKVQIFSAPDPAEELTALPQTLWLMGRGLATPFQELHLRSRLFGPHFYRSQCLTHYRVGNPANDRFQMYAYMKFVFFSVSECEPRKYKLHIGWRIEKVDSVMKELMAQCPRPRIFVWARTAPGCVLSIPSASSAEDPGQEFYPVELANVAYCYSVNPSVNPKTIDNNVVTFSFINCFHSWTL